jgi:glycosyltransferase involved in cell wall biosynthesis
VTDIFALVCVVDRVDEIWVPSSFLVDVFVSGGVPREKLVVVPIPIDTEFYSPLPFLPSRAPATATAPQGTAASPGTTARLLPLSLPNRGGFNFLSVFKWEDRKGWQILLDAYLKEFKPEVPSPQEDATGQ